MSLNTNKTFVPRCRLCCIDAGLCAAFLLHFSSSGDGFKLTLHRPFFIPAECDKSGVYVAPLLKAWILQHLPSFEFGLQDLQTTLAALRSTTQKSDISLDYCGRTMTVPHSTSRVRLLFGSSCWLW
jgi:hypothetical protein